MWIYFSLLRKTVLATLATCLKSWEVSPLICILKKKNDKAQFATSEFLFKKTCYNSPLPHWVFVVLRYRHRLSMEKIDDSYDANILEDGIGGELWRPIPASLISLFRNSYFHQNTSSNWPKGNCNWHSRSRGARLIYCFCISQLY